MPLRPSLELDVAGYERLARDMRPLLGIDLTQYKPQQVWRRVVGFASQHGCANPDELVVKARQDPALKRALMDMLTINVSEFFRNPEVWKRFAATVVRPLVKNQSSVRIWSAGCSSGYEPYVIAMLFREASPTVQVQILATDLDETILAVARAGRYSTALMVGVSPARRARFFTPTADGFEVKPEIRAMARFARHDLLRDPTGNSFDVIAWAWTSNRFRNSAPPSQVGASRKARGAGQPYPATHRALRTARGAQADRWIGDVSGDELEVEDVPQALPVARAAIVALGGYVGASSTSNFDDRPTAQITYRIPVDRWEEALEALRDLNGLTQKVVTEDTQAVEVTGQVIDLEARIKNLRASETALQGIAAKATRITDVLEVEARLTDVRGQIEQLTAQLTGLSDQAAYATLMASFNTPIVAVEAVTRAWEPATTVDEAAASLVSILQAVVGAGIWFLIVWLPILLVLGLIGWVVFRLARRAGFGRGNSQTGWQPPSGPPSGPPAEIAATDA